MSDTNISIDEATYLALEKLSASRGVSMGELVREAVAPLIGSGSSANSQKAPATLSEVERLNLSLLCEIRGLLTENEQEREMYETRKEIADEGFTTQYGELFLDQYEEMAEGDASLLSEILELFRLLRQSIEELDSTELGDEAQQTLTFAGFYSRSRREHKFTLFTLFLMRSGRYQDFAGFFAAGDESSSPARMLPTYQRMLEAFNAIERDDEAENSLTIDQLATIAASAAAE